MYSGTPKIDTPKIDTFSKISRNFDKKLKYSLSTIECKLTKTLLVYEM